MAQIINLNGRGPYLVTRMPGCKKVIFNESATIVLWDDGTKTVVKCQEYDEFSFEKGLLLCIAKKAYGNTGRFNDILREMMDRAYLQELPTRRVRLEDWITAPC